MKPGCSFHDKAAIRRYHEAGNPPQAISIALGVDLAAVKAVIAGYAPAEPDETDDHDDPDEESELDESEE